MAGNHWQQTIIQIIWKNLNRRKEEKEDWQDNYLELNDIFNFTNLNIIKNKIK